MKVDRLPYCKTDEAMHHHYQHAAIRLLDELLDIPSPPGREERMAQFLTRKIEAMGYTVKTDLAGNLTVRLPLESGARQEGGVVFAAHMDEIALVVSRIEPDGRLRVVRSGGMVPGKLGERMVQILGDQEIITGVVSCGTGHGKADCALKWSDYWIMTGLTPEQLRNLGIHPGAAVVPVREGRGPLIFGDPDDPLVAAWTFDDRMGVVTLLRLLERLAANPVPLTRPVLVAFTVHEEGGAHGAKGLNHRLRPDLFIAVDGCPLVPEADLDLKGGPVVWAKDVKTNYDARLIAALDKTARSLGLNLQRAVTENGYTDASASYDVGAAPRVGIVGYTRENSHGFEVAQLKVFDQLLLLLEQFLRDQESLENERSHALTNENE